MFDKKKMLPYPWVSESGSQIIQIQPEQQGGQLLQPIVEVRTISRPLTEVYAYLSNTGNLADWVPGISQLKPLTGSPTVGDAVTFTVNRLSNMMTFSAVDSQKKLA